MIIFLSKHKNCIATSHFMPPKTWDKLSVNIDLVLCIWQCSLMECDFYTLLKCTLNQHLICTKIMLFWHLFFFKAFWCSVIFLKIAPLEYAVPA